MELNYDLIVNADGTLYNPPVPEGLAKEYYGSIGICTKHKDPNYFDYECMYCSGCSRGNNYKKNPIPEKYKQAVEAYEYILQEYINEHNPGVGFGGLIITLSM